MRAIWIAFLLSEFVFLNNRLKPKHFFLRWISRADPVWKDRDRNSQREEAGAGEQEFAGGVGGGDCRFSVSDLNGMMEI